MEEPWLGVLQGQEPPQVLQGQEPWLSVQGHAGTRGWCEQVQQVRLMAGQAPRGSSRRTRTTRMGGGSSAPCRASRCQAIRTAVG